MILPIFTYGTKVLREKAKPVHRIDGSIIKLIMDMFDTMHGANGIGLAATQVGKLHRVIVVDISGVEQDEESSDPERSRRFRAHPPIALINPRVVSAAGTWSMEEGCLSIPGVRDMVERAEEITVLYKDTSSRDVELQTDGLLARVILHEIDHLNGVLFLDHLPLQRRREHREQLKKIQSGAFEVDYPVVTAVTKTVREYNP